LVSRRHNPRTVTLIEFVEKFAVEIPPQVAGFPRYVREFFVVFTFLNRTFGDNQRLVLPNVKHPPFVLSERDYIANLDLTRFDFGIIAHRNLHCYVVNLLLKPLKIPLRKLNMLPRFAQDRLIPVPVIAEVEPYLARRFSVHDNEIIPPAALAADWQCPRKVEKPVIFAHSVLTVFLEIRMDCRIIILRELAPSFNRNNRRKSLIEVYVPLHALFAKLPPIRRVVFLCKRERLLQVLREIVSQDLTFAVFDSDCHNSVVAPYSRAAPAIARAVAHLGQKQAKSLRQPNTDVRFKPLNFVERDWRLKGILLTRADVFQQRKVLLPQHHVVRQLLLDFINNRSCVISHDSLLIYRPFQNRRG
jgi:hypothetical protein